MALEGGGWDVAWERSKVLQPRRVFYLAVAGRKLPFILSMRVVWCGRVLPACRCKLKIPRQVSGRQVEQHGRSFSASRFIFGCRAALCASMILDTRCPSFWPDLIFNSCFAQTLVWRAKGNLCTPIEEGGVGEGVFSAAEEAVLHDGGG